MNLLHEMLHEGNVQSRDILGELFNYRGQVGLTGFFTPVDEQTAFELTGYMEKIDIVTVVDRDEFDAGNEPATLTDLDYQGNRYRIRSLKSDQSAHVLGLKMISATPTPPASGFSGGFSAGF